MLLVEGNIMDDGLLILGIKDVCCKGVDIGIAESNAVMVKVDCGKQGGIVTLGGTFKYITMGYNSILHPRNKIMIIIKLKAAFIQKVGSKDNIISKTLGDNKKFRVLIDHNNSIQFRVMDFI